MTRKIFSHRSFIALITGLSLAVALTGASAAPARADDDAARLFAGLVGLAIIGAAIEGSRDDRTTVIHQRDVVVHQPPRQYYQPQYPTYYQAPPRHQHAYQAPRPHHYYQPQPQREVKKIVNKKIVNKRVVHVYR